MTASFNLKEVTWQKSNSVFGAFIHLLICLNFLRLWSSAEVSSSVTDLGEAICFITTHKKWNKVNVRGSKGNVVTLGLKKTRCKPTVVTGQHTSNVPELKSAHNSYDFYGNKTITFPEKDTYVIQSC